MKFHVVLAAVVVSLIPFTPLFGDTFTDRAAFEAAVGAVKTIDFEGIATVGGQAGAVNLVGNEFTDITLTAGPGADGLFVGIPDVTIPGGNNASFFANDFFPTSGVAVFSPDKDPSPGSPCPDGTLIVDFISPTTGVGAFFLDPEGFPSFIEAFDGPGGTGTSLGKLIVQNFPDNSQSFAGITASGIRSAVLVLGGQGDGVGIDDLCFAVLQVTIDIKPGSCPNSFNRNSHGMLPVALVGSLDLDVTQVDISSILLFRADVVGGAVAPNEGPPGPHSTFEDVATPFDGELCDCHEEDGDGITDLAMKFKSQDVVSELQLNGLPPGDLVELCVSGMTLDGSEFEACDCVRLVPPGDVDGDGIVGVVDLLLLLAEWGLCGPAAECAADYNGDVMVGVVDLMIMFGNWG